MYLSDEALRSAVWRAVDLHVDAKRLLTSPHYADGDGVAYYAALSDASKRSLELQGGPFESAAACRAYVDQPGAREAVALRLLDDRAKTRDAPTKSFDEYVDVIRRVLEDAD